MNIKKYPLAGILVITGFCCSGREPVIEKQVTVEFQDDYVITSVDTGPKHLLGSPSRMAMDGQNQLYVLDSRESDVKVFDKEGHLIRVIGRLGEGPGELYNPNGIAIRGYELAVSCEAARRLTFYDSRDGNYLRMIRMSEPFSDFRLDSKGHVYAVVTDSRERTVKFQKFDSDLNLLKTFVSREWFLPNWYQVGDWIDVRSDDAIIYAHPLNHEYKILIFDGEGNITNSIHREYVPQPISVEDRTEVESMINKGSAMGGFDKIPEHYEPFSSMFADDAGRVFVKTRNHRKTGITSWDVFNSEGKFLCSFEMKDSLTPFFLWRSDRVYFRGEDEEGNPVIRVRKIVWKN